ncbi:11690_t:CDS:2, partial [Paraglomus brasilianum]
MSKDATMIYAKSGLEITIQNHNNKYFDVKDCLLAIAADEEELQSQEAGAYFLERLVKIAMDLFNSKTKEELRVRLLLK